MIRLLHLADVHLGATYGSFGRLAEGRREEVRAAVRRLPAVAEERDVHAVLVAGDLFDRPRPAEADVAAVREAGRRLAGAGIPVFAVPGNHDALRLDPALWEEALPEATVFRGAAFGRPETVEILGGPLHVYGVAYDPAEEPDPLGTFRHTEDVGLHVVLVHGSVPDAPHWEGGRALRLPEEALSALDADYLALGDYHSYRPPGGFSGPGLPACYPGSFAAVDLTEDGERGAVLVELEAGASPRLERVPSGVSPVVRVGPIDVTACADEREVTDAVGERVPEGAVPVVTLSGEPRFPLDAEKVATHLTERFGCASLVDETAYFASERLRELTEQKTVAGHVARLGLERVEGAGDAQERDVAERALRIALRALGVR